MTSAIVEASGRDDASLRSVLCRASARSADDGVAAFLQVRPRLFSLAYRMLGSVAESEDIVQDVWLRWQTADRSVVRDAAAFLITVTTRLAINRAKSGSSRRERYVGIWVPEPIDSRADSCLRAEQGEALELASVLLFEKLSPAERVAYVLREAFACEYSQIAEIMRATEVNCRQLVTRARKHIAEGVRATARTRGARRSPELTPG